MGMDGAAPDQPDELNELEGAIARETDAIAELEHRTRVLRVEVAGWKAPRGERSSFGYLLVGAMLGATTLVVVGAVLTTVLKLP